MSGEDYAPAGEGVKKKSTLSKLFKRKPVGGTGETGGAVTDADKKKYY